MSPNVVCRLVAIELEVVWVSGVATPFYDVIIVIESFLLDILVFACELDMSQFKVLCGFLQGHRENITLNLEVVIALADCAPP